MVAVERVWVAHDCGRAINPLAVEGQIQGSVWMGMGQALSEESQYHEGLSLRANLLDELRKPYVMTARARGLPEYRVIMRYPVRVALNPFVSTIGYLLPYVVSGSIIVSLVLRLPTVGSLLLKALIAQVQYRF